MLQVPTNLNRADVAFGNVDHLPRYDTLPDEFKYHGGNAYCKAITTWFFKGAKAHTNGIKIGDVVFVAKPGVDAKLALAAIQSCLGSFAPKHEHKEAGCAYMLSEWFDIEPAKAAS